MLERMLREAGAALSSSQDVRYFRLVDAAGRLFESCGHYHEEAQSHLEVYFAAHRRELDLLGELQDTVGILLQSRQVSMPPPDAAGPASLPEETPPAKGATTGADVLAEIATHDAWIVGTSTTEHAAAAETWEQPVSRNATATLPIDTPPTLDVYLLSPFQVYCNDSQITDWPNSKGKSVFKFLAANRERPIGKEVLMDIFWPEADASAARNNLNVTIYGLRKELTGGGMSYPFILFQDGCYLLNPDLRIWVDAEAFREHREAALRLEQLGDIEHAIQQYCAAEVLYQQPFLAEDRYEDWISLPRQAMEQAYREVLDRLSQHFFEQKNYDACALACRKMLGVDGCDEGPHRQLMRCYSRLGQPHLALRQFHACAEILSRELKLYPSPQTVDLFKRVRNRQPV